MSRHASQEPDSPWRDVEVAGLAALSYIIASSVTGGFTMVILAIGIVVAVSLSVRAYRAISWRRFEAKQTGSPEETESHRHPAGDH